MFTMAFAEIVCHPYICVPYNLICCILKCLCNVIIIIYISDAFIQSNLQCIQAIHFLSVHVFPGNRTHNLCAANAML